MKTKTRCQNVFRLRMICWSKGSADHILRKNKKILQNLGQLAFLIQNEEAFIVIIINDKLRFFSVFFYANYYLKKYRP